MARCRFVQPVSTVIHLSDGDWLEVKKKLSVGEARAAFASVVGEINNEGWRRPNFEMAGLSEMMAYIVDWSFTGPDGKRVPFTLSALKQLDAETFTEIETALEKHIADMDAQAEKEKNVQGSESAREPTSPSVS